MNRGEERGENQHSTLSFESFISLCSLVLGVSSGSHLPLTLPHSSSSFNFTSSEAHRMGFPGGSVVKNLPAIQETCRRCGFHPWVRKIPWRRKWQSTPVFLPGKSHGQRSLVGYSPWGLRESDTIEWLNNEAHRADDFYPVRILHLIVPSDIVLCS